METNDVEPPAKGEEREPMSFRGRTARVLALLSALIVVFLWGWALFFPPSTTAPGTLEDRVFPEAAQQICTDAAAELSLLPKAFETTDPVDRSAVITKTNVILRSMLDRLDSLALPEDSQDATNIKEWLGDWRTYVGDRGAYAVALTTDPTARFYVSKKEERQVSVPIDFFATFNKMFNCVTPDDTE
ncbi:MAG: hypothetical protein WEA11_03390 [Acidimicrobiales bacterium]